MREVMVEQDVQYFADGDIKKYATVFNLLMDSDFNFNHNANPYQIFYPPFFKEKPELLFLSPQEIDRMSGNKSDNHQIFEKIMALLDQYNDVNDEEVNSIIKEAHDIFICCMEKSERDEMNALGWIKEFLERLKNILREGCSPKIRKLAQSLIKLFSEIYITGELLGLYVHDKYTIFLCTERIVKSASFDFEKAKALARCVYVHEYTHFLHMTAMEVALNSRKLSQSKRLSPVLETVASTIEYEYAKMTNNRWLIDWVKRKNLSGVFPGWGYAGANILEDINFNRCPQSDLKFHFKSELKADWLRIVFAASLVDCHNAYKTLVSLDKMEQQRLWGR